MPAGVAAESPALFSQIKIWSMIPFMKPVPFLLLVAPCRASAKMPVRHNALPA